jgi:hypothetical protein
MSKESTNQENILSCRHFISLLFSKSVVLPHQRHGRKQRRIPGFSPMAYRGLLPKLSAGIGVSRRPRCHEHAREKTEEATESRGGTQKKKEAWLFHFVHNYFVHKPQTEKQRRVEFRARS